MSVFDKDIIQVPPDPQKYFEILCEREFGFNLTEGSIYSQGFNGAKLSMIVKEVRRAYPKRFLMCYRKGFGQMEIRPGNMFDFPDDRPEDVNEYDFVVS